MPPQSGATGRSGTPGSASGRLIRGYDRHQPDTQSNLRVLKMNADITHRKPIPRALPAQPWDRDGLTGTLGCSEVRAHVRPSRPAGNASRQLAREGQKSFGRLRV